MPKALRYTLILSLVHLMLSNFVGWLMCHFLIISDGLVLVFLPYTFVWSLSCMVGWDGLSVLFMLLGFLIVSVLFYPIGNYLANRRK